jgi:hypothetical protein
MLGLRTCLERRGAKNRKSGTVKFLAKRDERLHAYLGTKLWGRIAIFFGIPDSRLGRPGTGWWEYFLLNLEAHLPLNPGWEFAPNTVASLQRRPSQQKAYNNPTHN